MCKVLIFGGTTEGRLLASFCAEHQISSWISVTTSYGEMVLPKSPFLKVIRAAMDQEQMEAFLQENKITAVFDATHPYAALVTKNSALACEKTGVAYYRVLRDSLRHEKEDGCFREDMVWVESVEAAVQYLMNRSGRVLVTTGSKELRHFTRLDSFEQRIFARVLPSSSVLSACEAMGFSGSHLIAMQGPFGTELNRAMLCQLSIQYLVTKEAGSAGGFLEKIEAAKSCNIQSVVIGRPAEEKGISLSEAEEILSSIRGYFPAPVDGVPGSDSDNTAFASSIGAKSPVKAEVQIPERNFKAGCEEFRRSSQQAAEREKGKLFLIGTGMGGRSQMTLSAYEKLRSCQVIFGAPRMLDSVKELSPQALLQTGYAGRDILPWLGAHPETCRAAILYSGDTGFYSGAGKLAKALALKPYCDWYETEVVPGISSVSYFCARLKTSWEDVRLVSLHGRQWDLLKEVREHKRVFALTEGGRTIRDLCRLFLDNGYETIRLTVGERLSYPDERILSGTPKTMLCQEFDALAAVLMERDLQ